MSAKNSLFSTVNRNTDSICEFFDHWSLYRRIVDRDYLDHGAVKERLSAFLDNLGRPFSFLDLGCGDAEFSSNILKERPLRSYTGIDISSVALDLAETNIRALNAPCKLEKCDFLINSLNSSERYDIIYIGLSFHHLMLAQKQEFLNALSNNKLLPGGILLIFDPVLMPQETRNEYMKRWINHIKATWGQLSTKEIDAVIEHVSTSDYPEAITTFNHLAADAGFQEAEILYVDHNKFYALMLFKKAGAFKN